MLLSRALFVRAVNHNSNRNEIIRPVVRNYHHHHVVSSLLRRRRRHYSNNYNRNGQSLPMVIKNVNNYNVGMYASMNLFDNSGSNGGSIRWMGGRKGGASAFSKPRPKTKKQRRAYAKRQKKIYENKVLKHSTPPNSRARERRLQKNLETEYYLQKASGKLDTNNENSLEYDYGNALIDDLMGNTSYLTSMPTPKPKYFGHKYQNNQTAIEQKLLNYYQQQEQNNNDSSSAVAAASLPSDLEISRWLRSYRDLNSTKSKPLGIAKALQLLLGSCGEQQYVVPMECWGEYTYTTLMTCAKTPKEGRRIMKLMTDNHHPISSYTYSILLHCYTRLGDFRGAANILTEMTQHQNGAPPTLAAYTSFLAACYKVCNTGSMSQSIKAEAGKLAWNKWKEMRILGVEADVMAYGAIIRIMAARGLPEQAISLIEEMTAMSSITTDGTSNRLKPTTLIYTSALKAVARSHANAIRFHGGNNKGNKRRERIACHHGNMTRSIVIAAENAEVTIDDGYISALILCAATAGDAATAKAIYLAHKVRQQMDHYRTIGSQQHLSSLLLPQQEQQQQKQHPTLSLPNVDHDNHDNKSSSSLALMDNNIRNNNISDESKMVMNVDRQQEMKKDHHRPSFFEREYGKDTRIMTALLHANAKAMESKGLGNMWVGRDNKGYLCEVSLQLLTTRPKPNYRDNSIPGMTSMEVGLGSMTWEDEEPDIMSKQLRRKKFMGMQQNDDVGNTMDDIDESLYNMFTHDPTSPLLDNNVTTTINNNDSNNNNEDFDDYYFDDEQQIWKSRTEEEIADDSFSNYDNQNDTTNDSFSNTYTAPQNVDPSFENDYDEEEIKKLSKEIPELNSGDFNTFYKNLKEEIADSGENITVDETEAKELFETIRFSEKSTPPPPQEQQSATKQHQEMPLPSLQQRNKNDFDSDELDLYNKSNDIISSNNKNNNEGEGTVDFDLFYEKMKVSMDETGDEVMDKEEAEKLFEMFEMDRKKSISENDNDDDDDEFINLASTGDLEISEHLTNFDNLDNTDKLEMVDFESFYEQMKVDMAASGEEHMNKEEAKELFKMFTEGDFDDEISPEDFYEDGRQLFDDSKSFEGGDDFEAFYEQMKAVSGEDVMDKAEARQFFKMYSMDDDDDEEISSNDEVDQPYMESKSLTDDVLELDGDIASQIQNGQKKENGGLTRKESLMENMNKLLNDYETDVKYSPITKPTTYKHFASQDEKETPSLQLKEYQAGANDPLIATMEPSYGRVEETSLMELNEEEDLETTMFNPIDSTLSNPLAEGSPKIGDEPPMTEELDDLEVLLKGMPEERINKVKEEFLGVLGTPSILKLVPILRENMPEYVTSGWLKRKNMFDAKYVFEKAKVDGVVDIHIMNSMLEAMASHGSLGAAVDFHEKSFAERGITPTSYSDRLVLQMLIQNNRVSRALNFKQKVESDGRNLDLLSYGSLIEHYANKDQLGSAMMTLKECLSVHGTLPGERSLSKVRKICRRDDLEEKVQLEKLIGPDPLSWLRHGESNLKREYTKKGRRGVLYPHQRLLQV